MLARECSETGGLSVTMKTIVRHDRLVQPCVPFSEE